MIPSAFSRARTNSLSSIGMRRSTGSPCRRPKLDPDHRTAAPSSLAAADLVDMAQHVGGLCEDAIGAGAEKLLFTIAARQEADAERPGAPRRQHVPDRIAHHRGGGD